MTAHLQFSVAKLRGAEWVQGVVPCGSSSPPIPNSSTKSVQRTRSPRNT